MYKEFCDKLVEEFQKIYPSYKVSIEAYLKNNDVKQDALVIMSPNSNISPVLYIQSFYDEYQSGRTLNDIITDLREIYEGNPVPNPQDVLKMVNKYEDVKPHLFIEVINYKQNEEKLKTIPHQKVCRGELAIITRVEVPGIDGGSFIIHQNHLRMLGVTEEKVLSDALINTELIRPYEFKSMEEVINEMMPGTIREEVPEVHMYVLSNTNRVFGAATIFYPSVADIIAEKVGKDFTVLPSSIHEVLIIPSDFADVGVLGTMVSEINATQVEVQERLSDIPMIYDSTLKELLPMADYINEKERVIGELRAAGFKVTESLYKNIKIARKELGQETSLEQIAKLSKSNAVSDNTCLNQAIQDIGMECRQQQVIKMMNAEPVI